MNKDSTLYWSHLAAYESCPQQFLWMKGWDGIDLGYGPGKPIPRPEDDSHRHHALMGIAIQYAIEKFYNDELYREPTKVLSLMLELGEKEFLRQAEKPYNKINFAKAGMSQAEMLQVVADGITGYLQTMKAHRFLGPYAKAEVDLLAWVDKWNPIGGRADMIIRRDDTGVTILDGKNSKHKTKYTDPDQLRWYALLFFLAYREMPSRLGFVLYRFPYGKVTYDASGVEQVETGVDWVPCTEEEIKVLAQRAVDAKRNMMRGKFDPKPKPDVCRLCDFESICPARKMQREANAAKRGGGRKGAKVEEISEASDGFADLIL